MRAALSCLAVAAVLGCRNTTDTPPVDSGTIVGNPGDGLIRLAPNLGDTTLISAVAEIATMETFACGSTTPEVTEVYEVFDLLAGSDVGVPEGSFCHIVLFVEEQSFFVEGEGPNNSSFEITLPEHEWHFGANGSSFDILSDEAYAIQIGTGNGFESGDLGLTDDTFTQIQPGTAANIAILNDVSDESAVAIDDNDNGLIDDDEDIIAAGPESDDEPPGPDEDTGDGLTDEVSDDGCSCASPPSTQGTLAIALIVPLLMTRRRRNR